MALTPLAYSAANHITLSRTPCFSLYNTHRHNLVVSWGGYFVVGVTNEYYPGVAVKLRECFPLLWRSSSHRRSRGIQFGRCSWNCCVPSAFCLPVESNWTELAPACFRPRNNSRNSAPDIFHPFSVFCLFLILSLKLLTTHPLDPGPYQYDTLFRDLLGSLIMSDPGRKPLSDRTCPWAHVPSVPLLDWLTDWLTVLAPRRCWRDHHSRLSKVICRPSQRVCYRCLGQRSRHGSTRCVCFPFRWLVLTSFLGDSKSTSQKLSDEASSNTGSAQDTLSNLTQKASSTAGSTFENVQTKAADLGTQASDNTAAAQKNIQETASNVTQKAKDDGTDAQDTGKSYIGQAQEMAANALNSASKAASGKSRSTWCCFCVVLIWLPTDLANTISGEKKWSLDWLLALPSMVFAIAVYRTRGVDPGVSYGIRCWRPPRPGFDGDCPRSGESYELNWCMDYDERHIDTCSSQFELVLSFHPETFVDPSLV